MKPRGIKSYPPPQKTKIFSLKNNHWLFIIVKNRHFLCCKKVLNKFYCFCDVTDVTEKGVKYYAYYNTENNNGGVEFPSYLRAKPLEAKGEATSYIILHHSLLIKHLIIQCHNEVMDDEINTEYSNSEQIIYQANEDEQDVASENKEMISTEATIHIQYSNDR